jgi:internalin A
MKSNKNRKNISKKNKNGFTQLSTKFLPLVEGYKQTKTEEDYFWSRRNASEENIFSVNDEGELEAISFKNKSHINFELLGQCSSLTHLDIVNHQLDFFPEEILTLTNLTCLELKNCNISIIPEEISQLKKLSILKLSSNGIKCLPNSIVELEQLNHLSLDDNIITQLPANIGQLKKLHLFSVSMNKLKNFPLSFCKLKKLRFLIANNNEISELPDSIGQMDELEYIIISDNKLNSLPASFESLRKISHLQLSDNLFTETPQSIYEVTSIFTLDLRNNKINNIPKKIEKLIQLKNLRIEGNPINFPDPSFHQLSAQEQIQTILAMQNSILKPLKQAKILVVGDERVGKTSVINRLLGNPHNDNQTSTEGIDISELEFDGFKTNIWDFAGQELTHQTHQFFLTERSLYVYVLDAQKEDNQARDLHWLNTIKSYSDNSPIIIVVNHSDQNLNYRFDKLRYQDNFQIADVIYTSACNLNTLDEQAKNHLGDSIEKLSTAISLQLPKLPGIDRELPESWHQVKGAMENFKENLNVIEKDAFNAECEKAGVVGKPLQTALLKILNSIGTIVAFPNDFRLQLTQILKPEWVTNAVYKIVRSQSDTPGIYSEKLISSILDSDYTHTHQQWLIDLLIKFELGFRLPENSELLIPMRLPSVMPEYTKSKYQKGLNIRFNYHNNGLLKLNVLPQLIVRLHHYVDNDTSKYWRHGIFIQLKSCRGVIVADESKQIIEVFLSEKNEDARTLLQWIRSNIEKIEDSQTKANKGVLPYSEEIALFDDNCKNIIGHAKYEKIQRAFDKGKDIINLEILDPETKKDDDKDYNVATLLGLYKKAVTKFNTDDFPKALVHSLLSLTDIRAKLINEKEDDINDLLCVSLKGGGYNIADQSRGGYSVSGKGAGERDIVVLNEYGQQACLIEAMCLQSVVKKTINTHYNKLINNYNTHGNPVDFLVTYAKVKNFSNFWINYKKQFKGIEDITPHFTDKFNIKVGQTILPIEGVDDSRLIFHIIVNFGVKP